jgi:hypothetical protein
MITRYYQKLKTVLEKGKSIDTAVLSYMKKVLEALDEGAHTIRILIDLSKASDVLNHNLSLENLFHYGIRDTANLWFRFYLFHRRHFIEIYQSNSNSGKVNTYITCCMVYYAIINLFDFMYILLDIDESTIIYMIFGLISKLN